MRPIEGKEAWEPWYDKSFGFVIRAESEDEARKIADENAGNENMDNETYKDTKHPWLDPKQATCVVLTNDGKQELIIKDFKAA